MERRQTLPARRPMAAAAALAAPWGATEGAACPLYTSDAADEKKSGACGGVGG